MEQQSLEGPAHMNHKQALGVQFPKQAVSELAPGEAQSTVSGGAGCGT